MKGSPKNYSTYSGSTHAPGGSNFDGMLPSRKSQPINNGENRRPNSPRAKGIVPVGMKKGIFPVGG
jgi:hypothetical protein